MAGRSYPKPREPCYQIVALYARKDFPHAGRCIEEFAHPPSRAVHINIPRVHKYDHHQRDYDYEISDTYQSAEQYPVREPGAMRQRDLVGPPQEPERSPSNVLTALNVEVGSEHQPAEQHRPRRYGRQSQVARKVIRDRSRRNGQQYRDEIMCAYRWHILKDEGIFGDAARGRRGDAAIYCSILRVSVSPRPRVFSFSPASSHIFTVHAPAIEEFGEAARVPG